MLSFVALSRSSSIHVSCRNKNLPFCSLFISRTDIYEFLIPWTASNLFLSDRKCQMNQEQESSFPINVSRTKIHSKFLSLIMPNFLSFFWIDAIAGQKHDKRTHSNQSHERTILSCKSMKRSGTRKSRRTRTWFLGTVWICGVQKFGDKTLLVLKRRTKIQQTCHLRAQQSLELLLSL